MSEPYIECSFKIPEPNEPYYRQCAEVALQSLRQAGKLPQPDSGICLTFTNNVEISNVPPEKGQIVFFVSERKEQKALVKQHRTIILSDGLDHLPRAIATAIVARFHAPRVHLQPSCPGYE